MLYPSWSVGYCSCSVKIGQGLHWIGVLCVFSAPLALPLLHPNLQLHFSFSELLSAVPDSGHTDPRSYRAPATVREVKGQRQVYSGGSWQ